MPSSTSFARPEFDYVVYLCAAIVPVATVVHLIVTLRNGTPVSRPVLLRSIASSCIVVLLAAGLMNITRHSRWPRSGQAFAQHYNLRASEHGIIPSSTFFESNYTQRSFNTDLQANAITTHATIFDFFRANPHLFFLHMLENLKDRRSLILIFTWGLFVLWPWVRRDARHLRHASVFVLLIGLPCVAGTVMIYPRSHYAMVLIPSLTIYALQLFDGARWLPARPMTVLFAGCALIWLTTIGLPAHGRGISPDQIYLQRTQCLREIDRIAPSNPPVFDSAQIHDVYLIQHRKITDLNTLSQWTAFKAATALQHPAWISVDDKLAPGYGITRKQLGDFLAGDMGYTAHPCPFAAHLTVYTNDAP